MSKVLVVEDNPAILTLLAESLGARRDEFEVFTARNGQEAAELLEQQTVDIVVTDLNMPVMDGFGLLSFIKRHTPNLPVIVQTAMSDPEIDRRLDGFGALRVLQKPVRYKELSQEIRTALTQVSQGRMRGITLASFMQLVGWERKSCAIAVTDAGGRKGRLHFLSGELVNAYAFESKEEGEEAAYDILAWNDTDLELERSYHNQKRLIKTPMQNLLMEALRRKDEGERDDVEDALLVTDADTILEVAPETLPEPYPTDETTPAPGDPLSTPAASDQAGVQAEVQAEVPSILRQALLIEGMLAAALVDYHSGTIMSAVGEGRDLNMAALGNSEVVRTELRMVAAMGLEDQLEEVMVSSEGQYHLIRLLPDTHYFFYLMLDRGQTNLAMARHQLAQLCDFTVI